MQIKILNTRFILSFLLFGISVINPATVRSQSHNTSPDQELIKEAILDYVEGVYTMDTIRIYRSVHPSLVKRGLWYNDENGAYVPLQEMSFKQLVDLTTRWNKDGRRANANSMKDIDIYDVQDKTAAAKLTAVWGTDYFHLAKLDDKWYIINVLWQSPPKK